MFSRVWEKAVEIFRRLANHAALLSSKSIKARLSPVVDFVLRHPESPRSCAPSDNFSEMKKDHSGGGSPGLVP